MSGTKPIVVTLCAAALFCCRVDSLRECGTGARWSPAPRLAGAPGGAAGGRGGAAPRRWWRWQRRRRAAAAPENFTPVPLKIVKRDYDTKSLLATPPLMESQLKGRALFLQRCAYCHDGVGQPSSQDYGRLDRRGDCEEPR